MPKFLRRTGERYSKLGKGRKKKQKWRRPTGRDNKMREKRRGYPAVVQIGYKKEERKSALIIKNVQELENVKKENIVIVGKVGKKKKIEIAKKAKEMKIEFQNLNVKKLLKEVEKAKKKKVEKPVEKKLEKKEDVKKVEKTKSESKEKEESKPKVEKKE